jgi:hypothetical protein
MTGMTLVTLVACSSGGTATPPPTTDASTATSSTQPDPAGAAIADPKRIKGLDPCQLLTPSQMADLGVSGAPRRDNAVWGDPECDWHNDALGLTIIPETTLGTGISGSYVTDAGTPGFQKIQVNGYPATVTNKYSISCRVYVGVSVAQEFGVDFTRLGGTRSDYMDPCGFAEKVAGLVLGNLPAAS